MKRLFALAAACLAIAACDRSAETAPPEEDPGVVNLYTSRHYDSDRAVHRAFTEATGIEVRVLEVRPEMLVERMRAEGAASPADVVWMADAGAIWRAEAAGLLQPVRSRTLETRLPASQRHPDGLWFGVTRRARAIVYDPADVRPEEVATYETLADPKWRGRVCARSADNVYNLSTLAALIEALGRERATAWAEGVVANFARPPQGSDTDQIRAVAAGVCDVALTNSYYYLRLARSEKPEDRAVVAKAALAFPSLAGQGTLMNVSAGGVARHAPNREAAVRFLEFLTSDAAQTAFSDLNNEYPGVPAVAPPEAVAALLPPRPNPMPVAVYGRRQAEAQAVFDAAGWP
jgi:iron(III) transport system substrate-binding protein